jgi:hypothetical protein
MRSCKWVLAAVLMAVAALEEGEERDPLPLSCDAVLSCAAARRPLDIVSSPQNHNPNKLFLKIN